MRHDMLSILFHDDTALLMLYRYAMICAAIIEMKIHRAANIMRLIQRASVMMRCAHATRRCYAGHVIDADY